MTPLRWEIELPPKKQTYPLPAEAGVIAALIDTNEIVCDSNSLHFS